MRKLPQPTRVAILKSLLDGMSIRATAQLAEVSKNTVSKLLVEAGGACCAYHDKHVRGVKAQRVACDAVWSFDGCKQNSTSLEAAERRSDVWTWAARDIDSKLAISYLVGARDDEYATAFVEDLCSRLEGPFHLTPDEHKANLKVTEHAFGQEIDYARLLELYHESKCSAKNNSERMSSRRFTGVENFFSKKIKTHAHAVALHVMNYNFIRIHKMLKSTPAIAAGMTNRVWEVKNFIELVEEIGHQPTNSGLY